MIKNQHQLGVSQTAIAALEDEIALLEDLGDAGQVNSELQKLQLASLRSQLDDIQAEVDDYLELAENPPAVLEAASLLAFPAMLIANATSLQGSHHVNRPPYISQWGDLECNHALMERGEDPASVRSWIDDGYDTAASYRRWSKSTCGIACLQSILHATGISVPPKAVLIDQALSYGAFVEQSEAAIGGLYYQPFVNWVTQEFSLNATSRPDLPIDELSDLVATGEWYVIASVSKEIRVLDQPPTKRGGHLVLVFAEETGDLIFHNPSGLGETAEAARAPAVIFETFYAGRGILVRKNQRK